MAKFAAMAISIALVCILESGQGAAETLVGDDVNACFSVSGRCSVANPPVDYSAQVQDPGEEFGFTATFTRQSVDISSNNIRFNIENISSSTVDLTAVENTWVVFDLDWTSDQDAVITDVALTASSVVDGEVSFSSDRVDFDWLGILAPGETGFVEYELIPRTFVGDSVSACFSARGRCSVSSPPADYSAQVQDPGEEFGFTATFTRQSVDISANKIRFNIENISSGTVDLTAVEGTWVVFDLNWTNDQDAIITDVAPTTLSVVDGEVSFSSDRVDFDWLGILAPGEIGFVEYRIVGASDTDRDTVIDNQDNCPTVFNPDQTDANGDGFGDACVSSEVPDNVDVGSNPTIGEDVNLNDSVIIGDDAVIEDGVEISLNVVAGDDLSVGEDTTINRDVAAGDGVSIGPNVQIDRGVIIGDSAEIGLACSVPADGEPPCVVIGRDSTIGTGAVIEENVILERNVTVEPGTVVPAGSVIGRGDTVFAP